MFWPKLQEKLKAAMAINSEKPSTETVPRKQEAMLEEILELLRSQQRQWNQFERKVVTIGAKKVAKVTFKIPFAAKVGEGGSNNPLDVATSYSQFFSDLFDCTVSQKPIEDGLEMEVSFHQPIEREDVSKAFELAENVHGWRPAKFELLKSLKGT